MKDRYAGEISAFNQAYDMTFDSFDALAGAENWWPAAVRPSPEEARDNEAFLERILDRYYTTMVATIRRHDPNHLILGDKLNGNTDTPDFAFACAARHVDVIFYQWYGYYGEQKPRLDRWSKLAGKPLLNGDSSYSTPYDMMPRPNGPRSPTQEERAEHTLAFARQAFARPDFIGWHHCGWMDSWKLMPGKEVRQHSGLMDPFGRRYRPMVDACARIAKEIRES
jgi:hypothetical protein